MNLILDAIAFSYPLARWRERVSVVLAYFPFTLSPPMSGGERVRILGFFMFFPIHLNTPLSFIL
jgi:hypothetical protein